MGVKFQDCQKWGKANVTWLKELASNLSSIFISFIPSRKKQVLRRFRPAAGLVGGHDAVAGLHVGHLLLEALVLRCTILNLVVLGELGAK